jgi:hypothetical protein
VAQAKWEAKRRHHRNAEFVAIGTRNYGFTGKMRACAEKPIKKGVFVSSRTKTA